MTIVKSSGKGKEKLPRYTEKFEVNEVKLYPDVDEGEEASDDVEKNKYKKMRIELLDEIEIPDKQNPGQTVKILDGFNCWFNTPVSFEDLPDGVKKLYDLTEKGQHPTAEITYYVSVKTDPLDPKKVKSLKRISVPELALIKIVDSKKSKSGRIVPEEL